jgi:phosphatidylserine/phosphatidylglycerophosphate/cardiolipin synthase-like enzyme
MRFLMAAWLLAVGCADPADDNALIDDVDGAKEDALTSASFLKLIDGATGRVWIDLSGLSTTLSSHLSDAASRGVDVQVELVMHQSSDGAAVLAEQGLEATGVHVAVDNSDPLSGIRALIDDSLFAPVSGGKLKKVTDSAKVSGAVASFSKAVAEPTQPDDALPAGHVRLLPMPDSTPGAIVSIIDRAHTSIDLEIYQLEDPLVTAALLRAADRHVKVRVMLEPKTVGAQNYDPQAKLLAHPGIQVQPTPPNFDHSGNVDHAKFFVIDGKELLFGSGNLVRSGLGGNHASEFNTRDFWVRDSHTAAVAEGKLLFAADWARHDTLSTKFSELVVTPDNADSSILALIGRAKTRVYVYNQSLSDSGIIQALIAAKQRGADVRVLLGYQPGFGGQPPKNQSAIDQLSAASIPAHFFRRNYLHGKVVVSDDQAFVGSQNFTSGGLRNNRELGEILSDADAVDELASTFLADEKAP